MNKQTKTMPIFAAAVAALAWAGSPSAHHSLANFDLTAPLRVKGTVVRFERVNPHSIIYMDQRKEDGQVEHWAVIGPSVTQLEGRHIAEDFLKAGDSIEVCGFATKEGASRQPRSAQPASSNPDSSKPLEQGRLMNGHVLVMPDGRKWFWSDYGQLRKCVDAEELDSLVR